MAMAFSGMALPLDRQGFDRVCLQLEVSPADLWALLEVETTGCGFYPDGRPLIQFERHVFSRRTRGRFDASHPELSAPRAGGYETMKTPEARYQRLLQACELDRRAALQSTAWGLGQIMGFHAESLGFADVEAMVALMCHSELAQLQAMAGFLQFNRLDSLLRQHEWTAFARLFNGVACSRGDYDARLEAAWQRLSAQGLPDLALRRVQILLMRRGEYQGRIDGVLNEDTRAALAAFQSSHDLPVTDQLTLALLQELQGTPAVA